MMFCSIVIHGSMVGFWNAIPIRNALAATSRPPRMTTPVDGCTSPATSRKMVDLPQPDGPTKATNSPSAMRKDVVASAGTARSPRPKVTETSDSSIAIAGLPPVGGGTGLTKSAGTGCMRIISEVHASAMPAKRRGLPGDIRECGPQKRIQNRQSAPKSACN